MQRIEQLHCDEVYKELNDSIQLVKQKKLFLDSLRIAITEEQFEKFQRGDALDPSWQKYFSSLPVNGGEEQVMSQVRRSFAFTNKKQGWSQGASHSNLGEKQTSVTNLINAYRMQAHAYAQINPYAESRREEWSPRRANCTASLNSYQPLPLSPAPAAGGFNRAV